MKSKHYYILLISVFFISGCGNKNEEITKDTKPNYEVKKSVKDDDVQTLTKKAQQEFNKEEYNESVKSFQKILDIENNNFGAKRNIKGIETLKEAEDLKKQDEYEEVRRIILDSGILHEKDNIAYKRVISIYRDTKKELTENTVEPKEIIIDQAKEVTTTDSETEDYLINNLDEAISYLVSRMPQVGGPAAFMNGTEIRTGVYQFDYQLHGGVDGVRWNRIQVDKNGEILSDDYLKTVPNDIMTEVYEDNQEPGGKPQISEREATDAVKAYHNSLGRPPSNMFGGLQVVVDGYVVGVSTRPDENGDIVIFEYFVNSDGVVSDY